MEDINPVAAIKEQIWSIFNVLRSESLSSEDYHVVLFLLSAYNDGIVSEEVLTNHHHQKALFQLEYFLSDLNILDEQLGALYKFFEPAIKQLSTAGLAEIFQILSGIDKNVLSKNFLEVFDSVLYRISESQGRVGIEFIQPLELTSLICRLADLPANSKVFNPFAGLASFGVFFDKGQEYFGQELNRKTWALGALRLKAYERPGASRYVCEDSILNWPDPTQKFDLIVSNPPYGLRLNNRYKDIEPGIRTVEQFLLEKGVHSLTAEGKLITVLPHGFLFRGGYEHRLRKELVNSDLIETIISLPAGLLLSTGIPLVILVINKVKKLPGKVRFVDATKFVESKGSRRKVLNVYRLNSVLHGSKPDNEVDRIVGIDEIQKLDYDLQVSQYFQKYIEGVKLRDILEFVSGRKENMPHTGKVVRIKDLKNAKVDFKLDVNSVQETTLKRPGIHLINESCLLLAVREKTLNPTLFEFTGEPIYRNQDILSFKVDELVVDVAYIINELHADYVQEQLNSYRMGASVMPFIRREDLLEVKIKLPSLREQKAKVEGINELAGKLKDLQRERNALAHGNSVKQFSEFASLKHTLGRPRQNILDWSDNLLHFFSTQSESFASLNKAFAEFYDIDIIASLKEIKRDVNFITDVLEKGENGFVLSEYEKDIIPLSDINNIINDISGNGFNFKIKKLLLKGEKLKERGIYGHRTPFITILINLLTNASKYGFETKELGNEVVIELTEIEEILLVEVRNNGKPFPKNFDREKFITKFSTANSNAGSGLGGYDIHRIATDFNNPDWELSLNEDPIYPVKFKFQFPIKLVS